MNKDFERGVMFGILTMVSKRNVDELFHGTTLSPPLSLVLRAKMMQVAVTSACQMAGMEPPTDEEVLIMNEAMAKAISHSTEVSRRIYQEEGR